MTGLLSGLHLGADMTGLLSRVQPGADITGLLSGLHPGTDMTGLLYGNGDVWVTSDCKWKLECSSMYIKMEEVRCHEEAVCNLRDGVVSCWCPENMYGDGIAECSPNPCLSMHCPIHSHCVVLDDGGTQCHCSEGYTGDCESCKDIDECLTETHDCTKHFTCSNTPGSYDCNCKAGFTKFGEHCVDDNECELETGLCGEHAKCVNTLGSYECQCCYGYEKGIGLRCVESTEEITTGQKCCVCRGHECSKTGKVCSVEGGVTYNSHADLKIAECEEGREIKIDYQGHCRSSCFDVQCGMYETCGLSLDGAPTCVCAPCTPNEKASGPVCSIKHQTYTSACHFKEKMCEKKLTQTLLPLGTDCEDAEDPVTEWTEWSPCSVACGRGKKTRSREATRELSLVEEEMYALEVSAECFSNPCEDGEHNKADILQFQDCSSTPNV
ncbi:hypothetical protein ScPMuIL_012825 [Solemya velum]